MAAPLAAALAATLAASDGPATRRDEAKPALRSISSRLDGTVSTVLIEATEPVAYLTSQPDPLTVIVDLRNVAADTAPAALDRPVAPVKAVDVESATAPDGAPVARVRVTLERSSPHRVRSQRNVVLVEVGAARDAVKPDIWREPSATSAAPAIRTVSTRRANTATDTARPAPAAPPATAARATELRAIKAAELPDGYAVTLSGNGPLVASTVEEARDLPPRVLLDFRDVAQGRVPAMTPVNAGEIERVRVGTNSRNPLITRVVIDLAKMIPYTVETVGEEIRVLFAKAAEAVAAAAQPAAEPEPVRETVADVAPAPALEPVRETTPDTPVVSTRVGPELVEEPPAAPAVAPPRSPAPADPAAESTTSLIAVAQARGTDGQPVAAPPPLAGQPAEQARFSGHPVTLDFQQADLRAVLRTFAEISGLNIVIDPSIQGSVDVSLREVPWDQALDIILRANKLGYSVDGTIVRIAPLNVLAQENEERRKLTEAQALAGDLRVMTRALSYARAQDLVPIVTKSALSSRGDVQIDTRTNTLIIRDLPDRLQSASDLITSLDRPQPQVEIEARIVLTTRDFAQALGIQWGFNGRADPSLGNTTGLAFPNSGSIQGRVGPTQGPDNAPTAVNMGISAASSAVGLALGSINGALNLDVALQALERTGKGRRLSTPRVSTQNNVEAEITQGTQIPIQTVSNNTVTVTFKDAALTLRVTPQITASDTVIMRIAVENARPDFSRQVNGIPPIDTQRATTTVLVPDGDTTVIGGIYTTAETSTQDRTPVLNRIPLLGWLFKNNNFTTDAQELLIFITPRITR
jgi:type IV pilus assembly protein PilQ